MARLVRFCEVTVGGVFLVAAILKALDIPAFAIQIRHYGIEFDSTGLQMLAYGVAGIEAALGAAFLARVHFGRTVTTAMLILLVAMTALIAYGWMYHGLNDCGCFGKYVPMTPGVSILKNVILALVVVFIQVARSSKAMSTDSAGLPTEIVRHQVTIVTACLVAVLAAGMYGKATATPVWDPHVPIEKDTGRPFAQFRFEYGGRLIDLGEGRHVVGLLSATCDHCMGEVPALNELAMFPEVSVVALMLGNEDELRQFRASTSPEFPTHLIDVVSFFSFFGSGSQEVPPKFFLVEHGAPVNSWNGKAPAIEELIMFLHQTHGGDLTKTDQE